MVAEEGKRDEHTGECARRMFLHSLYLGKWKGLNFMSSCNQRHIKPGVLKVSGLGWEGTCVVLGEKAGKQPGGLQIGNRDLKNAWGIQWGDDLLFSECAPETAFTERPTPKQRSCPASFLYLTTYGSHLWEAGQHIHWLSKLLKLNPTHCTLVEIPYSFLLTSVRASPPEDQHKTYPHYISLTRVLQNILSSGDGDKSHFKSRPKHPSLKLTTFRPGTKHCPK